MGRREQNPKEEVRTRIPTVSKGENERTGSPARLTSSAKAGPQLCEEGTGTSRQCNIFLGYPKDPWVRRVVNRFPREGRALEHGRPSVRLGSG